MIINPLMRVGDLEGKSVFCFVQEYSVPDPC